MQLVQSRFLLWCTHHVQMIAFIGGFVFDTLTMTRIDTVLDNAFFVFYLVVSAIGIILVHGVETRRWRSRFLVHRKAWLPVLIQFPIGGLFSGFIIFYTKSANIFTSWLFLSLLVMLFVGNEFLHRRYERLVFQVAMYYVALTSYLTLTLPMLVGSIGTGVFVMSAVASLFLISLLLQGVMRFFPDVYVRSARGLFMTIGAIFVVWNVLYFTNIMPPVPLALKSIGVYHSVAKQNGTYNVSFEPPAWYAWWQQTSSDFHRASGEAAHCFSAVFAPTSVSTNIFHIWQRKNDAGVWVREGRIPFPIQGGRNDGYRGYTIMRDLQEGEWRCVVETERGQELGEFSFTVIGVREPVDRANGTR